MFAAAAIANFILLESTMLSVTRIPLTMAEDGYFHPGLAQVNPRFGTPALSILLTAVFCALLAVFTVPQLIAVYAWSRIATSTLTLISFWQMRRKYPDLPRSFRVAGGTLGALAIVILPMLLFAWALLYSDPSTRLWGTLSLVSGPVAYGWIRQGRPARDRV
jgi:amino acid transporter